MAQSLLAAQAVLGVVEYQLAGLAAFAKLLSLSRVFFEQFVFFNVLSNALHCQIAAGRPLGQLFLRTKVCLLLLAATHLLPLLFIILRVLCMLSMAVALFAGMAGADFASFLLGQLP